MLLAGLDDGQDESLRALAAEAAGSVSGTGYSFADSLKSLRGVATTVIIAGFAVPTVSPRATVCLRSKYSIVAGRGHGSASGLFVLQGGEDGEQDEDWIEELVGKLRAEFPRHAITLSVGERDGEVYRRWRDAGADRYLLRHETRNDGALCPFAST